MRIFFKTILYLAIFFILFQINGCGGNTQTTTVAPANTASLRVVQGDASGGTVNVVVDGVTMDSGIVFPNSSQYLNVKVGSQVTLQASGIGASQAGPLTQTFNVAAGSKNTFILDGWGTFGFSTMLLGDDNAASSNGNPKLRILDGAISTDLLDVYAVASGTTVPSGTPIFTSVIFNSASNYVTLAPGSYDIFFTVAAAIGGDPTQVLFHTGTINLAANQNRTVVLMNDCTANACPVNVFRSMLLADLN